MNFSARNFHLLSFIELSIAFFRFPLDVAEWKIKKKASRRIKLHHSENVLDETIKFSFLLETCFLLLPQLRIIMCCDAIVPDGATALELQLTPNLAVLQNRILI